LKWLFLALIAALPLQWFAVVPTPTGVGRLHLLALGVVASAVAARFRPASHRTAMGLAWPFVLASLALYLYWALLSAYHAASTIGAVEQIVYLGACVLIATLVYHLATSPGDELALLRWAAAAAGLSFVCFLSLSMLSNGVNPALVLTRSIAAADPEIIQKELFRSSFAGYGFDAESVSGNLRHEMFAAVLLAMYVSSWASRLQPVRSGARLLAYRCSMGLCVALLALSMSRAVLIAAAAWPAVAAWRSFRRGGMSPRQVVALCAVAVIGILVWFSGFAAVVWDRFTDDTSSYEARQALYGSAFQGIREHFLTGGIDPAGESSHNFVLDAWLRAGVLAALLAAVALLTLAAAWAYWLSRLHRDPEWMVPVVAAFALPLDRMLTAGGGLITPVGWVTLGFVVGASAYRLYPTATTPGRSVPGLPRVAT
jgi:hypothetical protein